MYRNTSRVTGTNDAPLGGMRRWGGASGPGNDPAPGAFGGYGAPSSYTSAPSANRYSQESAPPPQNGGGTPSSADGAPVERKRKSRWGAEGEKVTVMGMPVAIAGKVDAADLDRYAG